MPLRTWSLSEAFLMFLLLLANVLEGGRGTPTMQTACVFPLWVILVVYWNHLKIFLHGKFELIITHVLDYYKIIVFDGPTCLNGKRPFCDACSCFLPHRESRRHLYFSSSFRRFIAAILHYIIRIINTADTKLTVRYLVLVL